MKNTQFQVANSSDLPALVKEIGMPDPENAITQLKELFDKGYIDQPRYEFLESRSADGTALWRKSCSVRGWGETQSGLYTQKAPAKKDAALKMLCRILQY